MNDQPLDICLRLLAEGEGLEACLARFPEQRQELEPLLVAAMRMQSLRAVSAPEGFRQAARERLLAQMPAPVAPPKSPWQRFEAWMASLAATLQRPLAAPVLVRVAILVILVLGGLTATSYAAQTALPGSSLYSVKRLSEQVQLRLASDPLAYRLDLAQRRLDEAGALQERSQAQLVPGVLADYQETLTSWEKARAETQAQTRAEDSQRLQAQSALLGALAAKATAGQADAFAGSKAALDRALKETQAAPAVAPSPTATSLPSATPTPTASATPTPEAAATTPAPPTREATPYHESQETPASPVSPTPAPVLSPIPGSTTTTPPGPTSSPTGDHGGPPRPPAPPEGTPAPPAGPGPDGHGTPLPTRSPDGAPATPPGPGPDGHGTPPPTLEAPASGTPGSEDGSGRPQRTPGPNDGPGGPGQPPDATRGPDGGHGPQSQPQSTTVPDPDRDAISRPRVEVGVAGEGDG